MHAHSLLGVHHEPGNPPGPPVKVWVGRLPVTATEEFLERLLRAAGKLMEWKRITGATGCGEDKAFFRVFSRGPDPTTGGLKSFGFATWETPRDALLGLRLLQGLPVDDCALELKPGKPSEAAMDAWLAAGGQVPEALVEANRAAVAAVVEQRNTPGSERLKVVLRLEAERAEERAQKRRRATTAAEERSNHGDRDRLDAARRKRDQRARERAARAQERTAQDAAARAAEAAWEQRERTTETARARRVRAAEQERSLRLAALQPGPGEGLAGRRARVAAARAAREREVRDDAELRGARVQLRGPAMDLKGVLKEGEDTGRVAAAAALRGDDDDDHGDEETAQVKAKVPGAGVELRHPPSLMRCL